MTGRPGRGRVLPPLLDPVLAAVEGVDRLRRRIRPVRAGSLLGVERRQHRGAAVVLADGTRVAAGDRVWVLHFDNARLRGLATDGWQRRGYEVARDDLHALAAKVASLPPAARPRALTGTSLLVPLARRMGFEARSRPPGARQRLETWYLRTLLARWASGGRARLARGRRALTALEGWMSTDALLRRYGPPPE